MRRFRIPDWAIYALIVWGMYTYAQTGSQPTPPAPPEDLGAMLPAETPRDEAVLVEIEAPQSGTGTAFAIDDDGNWVTARHVVDSCDKIYLDIGQGRAVRVEGRVSSSNDTAVLRSGWQRTPLPSDLYSRKQTGQIGYFFGFPQGRPGEAVGTLISRGRMLVRGRYGTDEPVFAWAEVGRTAGLRGSLGGLSGGPALDRDGEVIGVVAAENPRRGRIYTVAPRSLKPLIAEVARTPEPIAADRYFLDADRLRRERRIVQVFCAVDS